MPTPRAALVVLLCLVATPVAAQVTTLEVNPAFRDAGTHTSQSVVVPIGTRGAELVLTIPASSDLVDTALTISLAVEASSDQGLTWHTVVRGNDWHGGTVDRFGNSAVPRIGTEQPGLEGQRVRVLMEVSRRVRIGAVLETY